MKKYLLISVTSIFSVVTVLMALYTEFFYQSDQNSLVLDGQSINSPQVDFNHFVIQNRHGKFHIKRSDKTWLISSDEKQEQQFPIKKNIIGKVQYLFSNLEIKREFANDDINKSHFSLNKPASSIQAKATDHDGINIQFGVTNPITQSTYLIHSNSPYILQVSNIPNIFFNHEMKDFIEHRVFKLEKSQIKALKIIRMKNGYQKLVDLKRSPNGEQWLNSRKRSIADDKFAPYIDELLSIQGHFLVSKNSREPQNQDGPPKDRQSLYYKIIMTDHENNEYIYQVFNKKRIKKRNEKNQPYVITSNYNNYSYLVSKDYIQLLSTSDSKFRKLGISKLFY